jgi:hypothetical protein
MTFGENRCIAVKSVDVRVGSGTDFPTQPLSSRIFVRSTLDFCRHAEDSGEAGRKRLEGHDPIKSRDAERAAARRVEASSATFRFCAEQFVASRELGWRNPKHAKLWRSTLNTYVYEILGDLRQSRFVPEAGVASSRLTSEANIGIDQHVANTLEHAVTVIIREGQLIRPNDPHKSGCAALVGAVRPPLSVGGSDEE